MDNFELSVQRFDQFAEEYAERFNNQEAYADSIDKFCSLITSKYSFILDLGCGPGNVTKILHQRFPDSNITAIDLSPSMIEIANKQLPEVDFLIMDVRELSVIPIKFDAIMCSFCLPFLSKTDAAKLIGDCARLLLPGGVLYISTMEGNEENSGFEPTSFSGDAEIYFNYHRLQDLEDAMKLHDFKIHHFKSQEYIEPNGNRATDLIMIGVKMGEFL